MASWPRAYLLSATTPVLICHNTPPSPKRFFFLGQPLLFPSLPFILPSPPTARPHSLFLPPFNGVLPVCRVHFSPATFPLTTFPLHFSTVVVVSFGDRCLFQTPFLVLPSLSPSPAYFFEPSVDGQFAGQIHDLSSALLTAASLAL